jgi:hypothetical protein
MIRDLLNLDTDPEMFLEKTLEDMSFIDQMMENLMNDLSKNLKLIERNEIIKHLSDLEWNFSTVLSIFLTGDGNISGKAFPQAGERVQKIMARSEDRGKKLRDMEAAMEKRSGEPLVSSDELNELLKEF